MGGGRIARASRPPPPALLSVSASSKHAAVGGADGTLSLYDLTSTRSATHAALGTSAASVVLRACGEKRARVAAFADRHGRVFAGAGGASARKKARRERAKAGAEDGEAVLVAEMPDARVVLAAGEAVVAAVGGARKELTMFELDGSAVRTWPLGKLHATALSAAVVLPGDRGVVVCGQAVIVVDGGSGECARRYQGHASPVSAVAVLGGGKMFVTGCAGDQFLSVWAAPEFTQAGEGGVKKRRKAGDQASALHTLVAPEPGVRHIAVDHAETGGSGAVAAQMPSGCVVLWRKVGEAVADSKPTSDCVLTIRPADEDLVLFCAFAKPGRLTVAHGHPMRPAFYELAVDEVDGEIVDLPAANTVGLLSSGGEDPSKLTVREAIAKAERTVSVAAKEAATTQKAELEEKTKLNGKGRPNGIAVALGGNHVVSEDEASDAEDVDMESGDDLGGTEGKTRQKGKKQKSAGGDDEADDGGEQTMEEKLASMGVSAHAHGTTESQIPRAAASQGRKPIDSIGNVLTQAIQTKDDKLFDSVLGQSSNPNVIAQTVSRMPFTVATGDFLHMLVTRLLQRPARTAALMPWIKAILMEHASALAAQGRSPVLDKLSKAIAARVETLPTLSRLEGRLELVVAQADRVRAAKKLSATRTVPAVEYVEDARQVTIGGDGDEVDSDEDELVSSGGEDVAEDEEDAEETGDFSEEDSDASDSSSWEDEEDEDEDIEEARLVNGKAKRDGEDLMDMSASESDN